MNDNPQRTVKILRVVVALGVATAISGVVFVATMRSRAAAFGHTVASSGGNAAVASALLSRIGIPYQKSFGSFELPLSGREPVFPNVVGVALSGEVDAALLDDITRLNQLTYLNLNGCDSIDDEFLKRCHLLEVLQELHIEGTPVTSTGVAVITHFPQLVNLDAQHTLVDDSVMELMGTLPRLTFLSLSHTRVTDVGIKRFASRRHATTTGQLTHLWLEGTQVTDHAITELGELGIVRLDLRSCAITDAGIVEMRSRFDALQTLIVSNTKITDASLPVFAALPKLRFVNAEATGVTKSAAAAVARPTFRVNADN